jgi:predicted DsbA family dithiol-disulfide isomerase
MHELLFHRQRALDDDDLRRYASELGLDVSRFDQDRSSPEVLQRIGRDIESGLASGEVRGTPTLFINGIVHLGGYDAATLMDALPDWPPADASARRWPQPQRNDHD